MSLGGSLFTLLNDQTSSKERRSNLELFSIQFLHWKDRQDLLGTSIDNFMYKSGSSNPLNLYDIALIQHCNTGRCWIAVKECACLKKGAQIIQYVLHAKVAYNCFIMIVGFKFIYPDTV